MIIDLHKWHTPASDYPRTQVGKARIAEHFYQPGSYYEVYGQHPPEDNQQYKYLHPKKKLRITQLSIGGKVWMVDDPAHWWAIQDHASHYEGDVLVAGLGLGLIVHALRINEKVQHITVIERSRDVITLITPHIPEVEVIEADWYSFKPKRKYNGIFFDLFVGNGRELAMQALREMIQLRELYPGIATCRIHGFNNDQLTKIVDEINQTKAAHTHETQHS